MPSVFIGTIGQIIADRQVRRDQFGFSYYVIFDHDMENVVPEPLERVSRTEATLTNGALALLATAASGGQGKG